MPARRAARSPAESTPRSPSECERTGRSPGLELAIADDQHVREPWRARRRGSCDRPTRCGRRGCPHAGGVELGLDRLRGVDVAVGDRQQGRLDRREPVREAAAVVLDQDPAEALHRAQQRAVDHHRPVLGVVGALVGQVEALGHLEVELAGAELPRAAERVGHVEVDLGPVEGAVAGVDARSRGPGASSASASAFSACSQVSVGADRLLRAGRELEAHVGEAELRVELVDRLADVDHLVLDLLGHAVDVGVVLGEGADAEEAMQDAGALEARDVAVLGEPQRQVAVGVALGVEDEAGARAVHRLQREAPALLLAVALGGLGEVHVLAVVVVVAGAVPEVHVHHLGGLDLR